MKPSLSDRSMTSVPPFTSAVISGSPLAWSAPLPWLARKPAAAATSVAPSRVPPAWPSSRIGLPVSSPLSPAVTSTSTVPSGGRIDTASGGVRVASTSATNRARAETVRFQGARSGWVRS
jgi:hypothetical protein